MIVCIPKTVTRNKFFRWNEIMPLHFNLIAKKTNFGLRKVNWNLNTFGFSKLSKHSGFLNKRSKEYE